VLSDYSKGFIKTNETSSINYYTNDIVQLIDGLTNLPEKEFNNVAKYFEQKKGQNINNAIVEMFEVIRSSTVNTRVQNVIDRSKDPKVAKEKRKLQDLVIEFEKISRNTKNEANEKKLYQELKTVKAKITNQKKIVLKKLNLSNISNFSEEITLDDIRQNLTKDQGIISYFIDPFYLYIFSITKEGTEFKKIKTTNKKIKSNIKDLLNTVKIDNSNKIKNFNFEGSNQLYNLIFKPIEETIKNKKDLIIVPHKALMSLPFGILTKDKVKQSNQIEYQKVNWLGKKYSISYYPSIYSFYNLQKIKSKNNENNFAGFGDPEFNSKKDIKMASKSDLSNLTMSRGIADADEIRKLSELPETSDELKFIANLFKGKSKLYLRKDFDEEKIKSLDLSNYRYISFATHAIVADQINNISEPGIILTPPKKSTKTNDGILTVSEIERLKLNSDIVILSACNTASEDGTPNAEGLSGLTSAFFQAGTKSMMVTHWDVETNSAVTLTTGTFDKMVKLKNLSKAMHKTKIEMMNDPKTSHPIYWAPFVLIGNVNNSIN
jgi:CHAT domain-containing protein